LGSGLNALLPLIFLPILTRFLSPGDYGIVATSLVLVQFTNMIIGLNASGLIAEGHFNNSIEDQSSLVSTYTIYGLLSTIILLLFFHIFSTPIAELSKFPENWLPTIPLISFCSVIIILYLVLLQSREEAKKYIYVSIFQNSSNLIIALILVVGYGLDWRGRIISNVLSGLMIGIICIYALYYRLNVLRLNFDINAIKKLLKFGVPLIPHFIGGWVIMMLPRLYLNNLSSLSDTGLFSVGYNLTSPLALLIGAANQAYMPELFKKLSKPDVNLLRITRYIIIGLVALPIIGICYGFFIVEIIPLIVGPKFIGVTHYIIWLSLAFSFQGICFLFSSFIIYSKKTHFLTWRADFLGGLFVLCFCPILISMNGPLGAAQSISLAFLISSAGYYFALRKAYPLPFKELIINKFQK